jgi:8-oxo-dGTP pyrophosphatase MutT (NUDIX family)
VEVVPAASVLLLRDDPFEVLMMQRHARSSFVPDVWVFPGGTLDRDDASAARSQEVVEIMKVCALRELFEETGIWLGPPLPDPEEARQAILAGSATMRSLFGDWRIPDETLTLTARWIAPVGIPRRFDTWFFLAQAGHDILFAPQPTEATKLTWIEPAEALARHARGDFPLVFPTIKNLKAIQRFRSAGELVDARRHAAIPITRPTLTVSDGKKTIVLPDDPC